MPTAPVRVHSQRPLAPSQSRLSANDKGDNEMVSGPVHRSGINLMIKESPRKPQPGDHHCLKWGPLPPNYIGRIAQHIKNGQGRKSGNDQLMDIEREREREITKK